MNDKLRKDVQNLLLDYEERLFMLALLNGGNIEHTLADELKTTNSLLETSVDLLRKCVVDDYKIIPQDQENSVQMNLAKSIMVEDIEALRDLGEKK
jgi:hypothetical protein